MCSGRAAPGGAPVTRLREAWRRRPLLTAAFLLAALAAVMFALRTVVFVIYWSNPAHHDRPLQPWMTPRYVARSWHLPPELVTEALQLETMPGRRVSLRQIAEAQGVSLSVLRARLVLAARRYRDGSQ